MLVEFHVEVSVNDNSVLVLAEEDYEFNFAETLVPSTNKNNSVIKQHSS